MLDHACQTGEVVVTTCYMHHPKPNLNYILVFSFIISCAALLVINRFEVILIDQARFLVTALAASTMVAELQ